MPQIVILDGAVTNPGDISWDHIHTIGDVSIYERTTPDQIATRASDAEIIITNKVVLGAEQFALLPKLKCICLLATGYNNIDIAAANAAGIQVYNAVGYSTASVAQHVFAMLLECIHVVTRHSAGVHKGKWSRGQDWSYTEQTIFELAGKTLGIYGYGNIGSRVAQIALAFGMNVVAYRRNTSESIPNIRYVSLPELWQSSDVLSLHAPLSANNQGIINQDVLKQMKPSAILINTGRGGLINESDLRDALTTAQISAAAVDVLSSEPPPLDHPLLGIENCIITPHIAWASLESRQRLIKIVADNITDYLDGGVGNVA